MLKMFSLLVGAKITVFLNKKRIFLNKKQVFTSFSSKKRQISTKKSYQKGSFLNN